MRSLEQYLIDCEDEGIIDFAFRAMPCGRGLQITIHPAEKSGDTVDYIVQGNQLVPLADTEDQ